MGSGAVEENQETSEYLRTFERAGLLFSGSLLSAQTGGIPFCCLSHRNIQVAVDNADLGGKTKLQKQALVPADFSLPSVSG